jgi:hypothetical protein
MKKTEIVSKSSTGTKVELNNLELTLIQEKWNKITQGISKLKSIDNDLAKDITHFSSFMEKLSGEVLSLDNIYEGLFSSEPITDEEMEGILEASTGIKDRTTNI